MWLDVAGAGLGKALEGGKGSGGGWRLRGGEKDFGLCFCFRCEFCSEEGRLRRDGTRWKGNLPCERYSGIRKYELVLTAFMGFLAVK